MASHSPRARYLSLRRAAREVGIDPSQLSRLWKAHPLFIPAIQGLPGVVGSTTTRFHREQVRLIEGVMVGNIDLDSAWLEWRVVKQQIGMKPIEPESDRGRARGNGAKARTR